MKEGATGQALKEHYGLGGRQRAILIPMHTGEVLLTNLGVVIQLMLSVAKIAAHP